MTNPPATLETIAAQHGGILTVQQAEGHGVGRQQLIRALKAGWLERVQRGVYRLTSADIQPFEAELEVQLRIPHAVIALGNALAFHGLTTLIPKIIEISLERGRKAPNLEYPRIKTYYDAKAIHHHGIQTHRVNGQTLRVYSPEKTLMDLLRREREALFAEGMKRYLLQPKRDFVALLSAAKVCRVEGRVFDLLLVEGFNASV